jgi:arylsulfatase A-like enzyme
VIVILTDDMGIGDVACFGGRMGPTPNIDALAKNGLQLGQYYSAAPICSPSRAGLLTGAYPGRWNFSTYLDNRKHNREAEQADFLDPNAPTMAKTFRAAGYATGHFGKWHMGGGRDVTNAPGFDRYGFDEHASTYESPDPDPQITATNWIWSDKDPVKRWDRTKYFVDKTLDFLRRHRDQPCFVNLWPDDVHTPWVPRPDGDAGTYPANQEGERALKWVLKEYDLQIGRLMKGLREMGIEKDTIVLFTSDNGPLPTFRGRRVVDLRGSKLSLYEGGTRMPFLAVWPGRIPAGKVDDSSEVTALDLLPTLAKLAGVPLPKGFRGDGKDRSDVLRGRASLREKEMYWEYGRNEVAFKYPRPVDRSPSLAIRSGKWKLLMNPDGSRVELYDIVADRTETKDLAASQPEVVKSLRAKLSAWWQSLPKRK